MRGDSERLAPDDAYYLYFHSQTIIPIAYRDYVKGHEAGAATCFGYYGGGLNKV